MGKISHLIVDVTDPRDEFECEGAVIKTFFSTSPIFSPKNAKSIINPKGDIDTRLRRACSSFHSIFHLAAHGTYFKKTKRKLDYSVAYQRKGRVEREVFRADTIVRASLQADVFVSTCCQTFNDCFIETLQGYREIYNFIAPVGSPLIGDTIVFSLMFYNELIRRIQGREKEIKDKAIIESFQMTNEAYRAYEGEGDFRLYNVRRAEVFK